MENLTTLPEVGERFRDLSPEEPEKVYPSSFFTPLLPDSPVAVGETWALDREFVETLLSQFSSTVQGEMNFDGSGAFATLRARTDAYWEIAVRMHAQFAYPGEVYLSPSSFEGRVVIDLRGKKVEYLSLFVPHHHERNIAFEVHSGEFLTGLGSAPRIELSGGGEALHNWTEEIPEAKARELLAQQFFPFEKLDWLPLDKALERAAESKSPLFVVVIEGALTDQSC
jgi:hypothetical protein